MPTQDFQDLPLQESDELDMEEIAYMEYVKRKIEEGIRAADDGRIISHDEVKQILAL